VAILVTHAISEATQFEEAKHRDPRARNDEERGVAVQDEYLVHVFVQVVILLLALPLGLGQVRHDGQRAGPQKEGRVEGALLFPIADERVEPRESQLEQVLQREAHDHEDGQLRAQVFQAITSDTLHRHHEERLLILEERNVVQRDVAIEELEDNALEKLKRLNIMNLDHHFDIDGAGMSEMEAMHVTEILSKDLALLSTFRFTKNFGIKALLYGAEDSILEKYLQDWTVNSVTSS